jgi:DNA (cytosine-5)-methyltransferase 1
LARIKFIDLFAGIGGFRQALESRNNDCVFSSEWDSLASRVYQDNYNDVPFGDITKILAKDIPAHDILCAGFPCQAFSVAGKRLGFKDTRGTLFFDIERILKYHTPKVVLLENVKNFRTHDSGQTFKIVKSSLEKIGYSVFSQTLKSSDFGVPQARERFYIVAIYNYKGSFFFPKPTRKIKVINDILLSLSTLEKKELQITRNDIDIYKNEKDILDPKKALQIGKINKGGQGERIYSRFASGITLSAYGGGAAAKTGAYKIGKTIRKLHPVECLRLQGFPDAFKLNCSRNQSYQLLGNSVTTNVIKAIYKEIERQVLKPKSSSQTVSL